jgi:hypothetical protein
MRWPDTSVRSAARLARFLAASSELMKVMARARGPSRLDQFSQNDITTWKREMADLTGIKFAGVGWCPSESVTPSTTTLQPKQDEERSMSTQDNLQAAFAGESQANRKYLAFATKAEGNKAALISFRNANTVEKTHYDLYSKALETLEAGKDLTPASIYVCDVCGHTHVGEAPDKCPVCGAPKSRFKEVV